MNTSTVFLFTDFGLQGPYVGLMEAAIEACCPAVGIVNLMADAPSRDPRRAAYLLGALKEWLPSRAIVVAVVDPGVGGDRRALAMQQGDRWFIGPDNGLLSRLGYHNEASRVWELQLPKGKRISASFHGRDLFAPAAARIACGEPPVMKDLDPGCLVGNDWPEMLEEVIYVDAFGNAMTGIPAVVAGKGRLRVGGTALPRVRTFSDVQPGQVMCYVNSLGLLEIAANGGSAAVMLGLETGTPVELI